MRYQIRTFYIDIGGDFPASLFHTTETYYSRENLRVVEYDSLEALLQAEQLEQVTLSVGDAVLYWPEGSDEREMRNRILMFSPPTFVYSVELLADQAGTAGDSTTITPGESPTISPVTEDHGAYRFSFKKPYIYSQKHLTAPAKPIIIVRRLQQVIFRRLKTA